MRHYKQFIMNKDWNYNKRVRELIQNIQNYELHAKKEIENNKVARPDKVRDNSQRYLEICKARYKDFTGEEYKK
jgi:hypothetical protein